MKKNNLIIAAAGSGKTQYIIDQALDIKNENVLITSFTEANGEEIKRRIIKEKGFIPRNITIQTWFSFLLQHGVKPYQSVMNNDLHEKNIGFCLVSGVSASFISENLNFNKHYFTKDFKIYSDKISKFEVKCDKEINGEIINRISRIFPNIFIDEVQDLAGYDLELLKLLFNSKIKVLLVGDPRQGTYSTNNAKKNSKFKQSQIISFFEDNKIKELLNINDDLLTTNYRCNSEICTLSNKIFPKYKCTNSVNNEISNHDGLFIIKKNFIEEYLRTYPNCVQLRRNIKEKGDVNYPIMNFGDSKGLTFERVLIYPTEDIKKWIKDNNTELAPTTLSKFYVAVTRAKYSVAIVYDYNENEEFSEFKKYQI